MRAIGTRSLAKQLILRIVVYCRQNVGTSEAWLAGNHIYLLHTGVTHVAQRDDTVAELPYFHATVRGQAVMAPFHARPAHPTSLGATT